MDELTKVTVRVKLPDYPKDCQTQVTPNVVVGDRLDTAILKVNNVVSTQNARIMRCTLWYGTLKSDYDSY